MGGGVSRGRERGGREGRGERVERWRERGEEERKKGGGWERDAIIGPRGKADIGGEREGAEVGGGRGGSWEKNGRGRGKEGKVQ